MKDKARFQERSPINFVGPDQSPLLLLAGGNDPGVPKQKPSRWSAPSKSEAALWN